MIEKLHDFGEELHHLVDLERLPESPYVVDAGACVGLFCREMLKVRSKATILAMEPSDKNWKRLLEAYDEEGWRGNVICLPVALGSTSGVTMMHDVIGVNGKYYQWASTQKDMAEKARGRSGFERIEEYPVKKVTLDACLLAGRIDYLKMDIEGAEKDVIMNMTPALASCIDQLSLECHGDEDLISNKLEGLGFNICAKGAEIYGCR